MTVQDEAKQILELAVQNDGHFTSTANNVFILGDGAYRKVGTFDLGLPFAQVQLWVQKVATDPDSNSGYILTWAGWQYLESIEPDLVLRIKNYKERAKKAADQLLQFSSENGNRLKIKVFTGAIKITRDSSVTMTGQTPVPSDFALAMAYALHKRWFFQKPNGMYYLTDSGIDWLLKN